MSGNGLLGRYDKKGPKKKTQLWNPISSLLCILEVGFSLNLGDAIYTAHLELFLNRETRMAKDR